MENTNQYPEPLSLEERLISSEKLLKKYPNKIPIICTKSELSKSDIPTLKKNKFLVSKNLTLGQFLNEIRNQIKLPSEKALFVFVNNQIIPPTSSIIQKLYDDFKSEDNFLYMTYTSESTFG